MKTALLMIAVLMVGLAAGCVAAPQRAEKPAFKGMDLYSWKPEGKDWHFRLLPGTNRLKPPEEITRPDTAVVGISELKKRLFVLAKGESVLWRNWAREGVPVDMAKDLNSFCEELQIKLYLITESDHRI